MSLVRHVFGKTFSTFTEILKNPIIVGLAILSAALPAILLSGMQEKLQQNALMQSSIERMMAQYSEMMFKLIGSLILISLVSLFIYVVQIQLMSENRDRSNEDNENRNIFEKYLRVLGYSILVFIFSIILSIIFYAVIIIVFMTIKLAGVVLTLMMLILLVWASIKISQMVFAIVVDNEKSPISKSFELTEGQFFKILFILIFAVISLVVGEYLFMKIANYGGPLVKETVNVLINAVGTLFMVYLNYNIYERLKELKKSTVTE